jgi:hypothetical protein
VLVMQQVIYSGMFPSFSNATNHLLCQTASRIMDSTSSWRILTRNDFVDDICPLCEWSKTLMDRTLPQWRYGSIKRFCSAVGYLIILLLTDIDVTIKLVHSGEPGSVPKICPLRPCVLTAGFEINSRPTHVFESNTGLVPCADCQISP